MTGYIVKKKGLYYYKCRKKGCKCNKSAKEMHRDFMELLAGYSVKSKLLKVIVNELECACQEKNKDNADKEQMLLKRIDEVKEQLKGSMKNTTLKKK